MNSSIIIIAALVVVGALVAVYMVKQASAKAKAREWKEHAKKRSREQHHEWEEAKRQAAQNQQNSSGS